MLETLPPNVKGNRPTRQFIYMGIDELDRHPTREGTSFVESIGEREQVIVRIDADDEYPVYTASEVNERANAYGHQVWVSRITYRRWERTWANYYRMQEEMKALREGPSK